MLLGIMCGCSYARTNELSRLDRGRSAQLTKDGMFATENLDSQTPLAIVTGVVASVNQLQELQGGADSTLLLSGARVNRADGYSYPDSYTVQPQRSDGIILNHTLQAEDDPMRDGCDSERNKVIDRETMILTPFVTKDGRKNEDLRWRTPNHSCDSSNCELLIFGIETFSHVFKCLDGGSASTEMWLRICQPMLRYQTLAEEPVSNQQLMLLMVKPNSQVECGSEVLIQYCDPDRHRIQRSQLGYCSTVCGCNQAALPHFMNNELIKEGAGFGSLCQSMVSVSKEWLQAKDILRTAVAAMHTANTRLQESATELVSRGAGSALGDLTHNASSSHPKDDEIDNGKILILATESDSDEMVMRSLCGLENHHDY